MKKYPSPLKAIRKHCMWCCLDQPKEVRLCGATGCPIYPLRFGKKVEGLNVLKAIREKCCDCGGYEEPPKKCGVTECDLYPFRCGKNPNREGIGNHHLNDQLNEQKSTPRLAPLETLAMEKEAIQLGISDQEQEINGEVG